MDQFTVPQFIEHKTKIIGPLTFRQFIFIGAAGGFCLIFYFTAPFFVFVLVAMMIMPIGAALAFLKSGGRSLPIVLKNFFGFSLAPKMYLWKRKVGLPPKIRKAAPAPKEIEKSAVPTAAGKSRLNALSTQIETKIDDNL